MHGRSMVNRSRKNPEVLLWRWRSAAAGRLGGGRWRSCADVRRPGLGPCDADEGAGQTWMQPGETDGGAMEVCCSMGRPAPRCETGWGVAQREKQQRQLHMRLARVGSTCDLGWKQAVGALADGECDLAQQADEGWQGGFAEAMGFGHNDLVWRGAVRGGQRPGAMEEVKWRPGVSIQEKFHLSALGRLLQVIAQEDNLNVCAIETVHSNQEDPISWSVLRLSSVQEASGEGSS
ncbi:hypothetical protein Taro_002349 [Colocasia esculenta]|uniref:Uncharacterized protein n=1 Tax=Colocasia esculenta TaxID=4460 RepID=A0A843TNB7_COLES|nr:hypothetical protein [Colocasia esculenta]